MRDRGQRRLSLNDLKTHAARTLVSAGALVSVGACSTMQGAPDQNPADPHAAVQTAAQNIDLQSIDLQKMDPCLPSIGSQNIADKISADGADENQKMATAKRVEAADGAMELATDILIPPVIGAIYEGIKTARHLEGKTIGENIVTGLTSVAGGFFGGGIGGEAARGLANEGLGALGTDKDKLAASHVTAAVQKTRCATEGAPVDPVLPPQDNAQASAAIQKRPFNAYKMQPS